jgi:hypothetical protein
MYSYVLWTIKAPAKCGAPSFDGNEIGVAYNERVNSISGRSGILNAVSICGLWIMCNVSLNMVGTADVMGIHCIIFILMFPILSTEKLNSVAWARERTIPTERPPLVGEVAMLSPHYVRLLWIETLLNYVHNNKTVLIIQISISWNVIGRFRLCGLVVRVPGYTTEMYCDSCEVRTEFI